MPYLKKLFSLKLLNVRNPKNFFFHCIHAWCKNIESYQKNRELSEFESCPHAFASTEYNPLLQILSFGVISQKSEFFVKNGLNKTLFFLKVNIYNLKLYLTRFYGSSYAVLGRKFGKAC
ncbi:hypothetical protein COL0001_03460 [Helicobacter pylori]